MLEFITNFYTSLLRGDLSYVLNADMVSELRKYAYDLYTKKCMSSDDIICLEMIVKIGNIVYNNTDLDDDSQPIDNDLYDLLLEKYKTFNHNYQVGAIPIKFDNIQGGEIQEPRPLIVMLDPHKVDNMIYRENLLNNKYACNWTEPVLNQNLGYASDKKYRNVAHGSPDLVGTLDKCKYVLNSQAREANVFNDPSVKILERDFFQAHFYRGIVSEFDHFRMVLELKYDGVSVEASISNGMIVRAASRGDTGADLATDLTPIFYGYRFPNLPKDAVLDCKFEAIMTTHNLDIYNYQKGKSYKNCRSAISGLIGSNDGFKYQNFITLVPLKIAPSSLDSVSNKWVKLDRIEEIEFMNQYLVRDVPMKWAFIEGDYKEILFLIKKFVDEAEYARPVMGFMYDGIVVSYIDDRIINILGRENYVNKYSCAVKFNPLKKQTRFLYYSFNVGQDGTIVPMFHYDPISFLGTIHTKSTGSSYDKFMNYALKKGDIVEVEYRNDVMPYVYPLKSLDANIANKNPVIPFPIKCPSCGGPIVISESGKSAKCINIACPERNIQRAANMLQKLGIKDFSEATVVKLGKVFFKDYMLMKPEMISPIIGDINASKFVSQMKDLYEKPVQDFIIVGALGFTGIAQDTWKKILARYSLHEFLSQTWTVDKVSDGTAAMLDVKGVGPKTWTTIYAELPYFRGDLEFIASMPNLITTKGTAGQKKIRVTGFRDEELMKYLCSLGYDASDKGVTKDTSLLLTPSAGFHSSKVDKTGPNTMVMDVNTFKSNINYYLQFI